MNSITVAAPAKINWRLEILGKRADGYHILRMLNQQVELADAVTLKLADADTCTASVPIEGANLALKAWLKLKEQLGRTECLHIHIEKNIPLAAGLAGGSADAAAVLRGAVQLLQLPISDAELLALGLSLGADIPFCLTGGLMLVEGIGEELMPLTPSRRLLVIANPGCQQSTKAVFAACGAAVAAARDEGRGEALALAESLGSATAAEVAALCRNDMLAAAEQLSPQIGELMADFAALGLAPQLSGSGATVFALCDDPQLAEQAAAHLKERWPFAVACHTIA